MIRLGKIIDLGKTRKGHRGSEENRSDREGKEGLPSTRLCPRSFLSSTS